METQDHIRAFGVHLRKLREEKGLSQQELADEAEVDKKTIQRIENGRLNPSLNTLSSIAKGLKVHLKELFDY